MELNCDVQRKRKISDLRPIASIDMQLRIYYEHAEIGTDEVRMLFGQNISNSTVCKLKKLATKKREEISTTMPRMQPRASPKRRTGRICLVLISR